MRRYKYIKFKRIAKILIIAGIIIYLIIPHLFVIPILIFSDKSIVKIPWHKEKYLIWDEPETYTYMEKNGWEYADNWYILKDQAVLIKENGKKVEFIGRYFLTGNFIVLEEK